MPQIAKGAFVHPSAELDDDVIVQPYAYIGPKVKIGAGTVVGFGAVIERRGSKKAGFLIQAEQVVFLKNSFSLRFLEGYVLGNEEVERWIFGAGFGF